MFLISKVGDSRDTEGEGSLSDGSNSQGGARQEAGANSIQMPDGWQECKHLSHQQGAESELEKPTHKLAFWYGTWAPMQQVNQLYHNASQSLAHKMES